MDGDSGLDARSLVSWKPRKLAIFVSLRHDSPSLDVSGTNRQWPSENQRQRNLAFRGIGCDQRHGYLAISLDRANPALASTECQARKTWVTIVFLIGLADSLADIRGRLRVKKAS